MKDLEEIFVQINFPVVNAVQAGKVFTIIEQFMPYLRISGDIVPKPEPKNDEESK